MMGFIFTIAVHFGGVEVVESLLSRPRVHPHAVVAYPTGSGLPFVLRIVEAHGGAVQLQSRGGEGTTVSITLPCTR